MIKPAEKLLRVNKAWFADGERVIKDRLPGAFKRLVNIVPNLSDGIGQLRTGYQPFNSSFGGINFNLGDGWTTEVPFVFPVQSPLDYDAFLLCQVNGANFRVAMYPHWIDDSGTAPIGGIVPLAESLIITSAYSLGATDDTLSFTAASEVGLANLVTTADYYNGWIAYNHTKYLADGNSYIKAFATIRDWALVATDWVMFFVEDIHTAASNMGWSAGDDIVLYRNFHENPYDGTYNTSGFNPKYNDDKANPPTANVQNSIIRFSGGQGNHANLRGLHVTPKLTRTFFPDHARTMTYDKTYAAERELKMTDLTKTLRPSNYVSTLIGGETTEEISPDSTLYFDTGSMTQVAASGEYHEKIDEGSGVSDATKDTDYIQFWPVSGAGVNIQKFIVSLPKPTKTFQETGSTTVHFRYEVVPYGGFNGTVSVYIYDSGGNKGFGQVVSTDTSGVFVDSSFTFLNAGVDSDSWYAEVHLSSEIEGPPFYLGCKVRISVLYMVVDVLDELDPLTPLKTYWVGIAPIYDGFQIGNLKGVETLTDYPLTDGDWLNNYLQSGTGLLNVNIRLSLAQLNKRITGYAIYCALDEGRELKRKNPYQYMKFVSLTASDGYSESWTYDGATGTFNLVVAINQQDIETLGGVFETDAGYVPNFYDTMYAYSIEAVVSNRRLMSNVYLAGEQTIDRANVFTNPIGQNPDINLGVLQPDIFSNEEAIYRLRVDPLVGTKINCIIPVGLDEFLVLKDRGVISARIVIPADTPDIVQEVISHDVGAATVNSFAKDDDGVLYFNGYDDIYAYKNGQLKPLIERPDKNDWLYTYQQVLTKTDKESSMIIWMPEIESLMFLFKNTKSGSDFSQMQYLFHRGLWSEIALYDSTFNGTPDISFRWATQLRNGHILCTSTEATPAFYRLSWLYSSGTWPNGIWSGFVYTDNAVGISPYFDTGNLLMEGKESEDIVVRKLVINRTLTGDTLAGSLDVTVYNENGSGYSKADLNAVTTDERITCRFGPTTIRKGQSWRAIYNKAATGRERITAGQYQINSLEYFGRRTPRVRSTGK